jgi:hypothetical protein
MGDYAESLIRVILFTGKKGDWSAWEERFLAKARRKGFKDLLLGKVTIPDSTTIIDESTAEGKATKKVVDLNDLAYSKLILSTDVTQAIRGDSFRILKG